MVIDNGSNDETEATVRAECSADRRIQYIKRERNIPPYDSIRMAIATLDTPFFTICGDDDFVFPWHLETLLPAIENDAEIACCFGLFAYVGMDGEIKSVSPGRWPVGKTKRGQSAVNTVRFGHIAWQAGIFRTADVRAAGGGPFGEFGLIGDVEFLIRLGMYGAACFVERLVAVHTCHEQQGASAYSLGERKGIVGVYQAIGQYHGCDPGSVSLTRQLFRQWMLYFLAMLSVRQRPGPSARELLLTGASLLRNCGSLSGFFRFARAALVEKCGMDRDGMALPRMEAYFFKLLMKFGIRHNRPDEMNDETRSLTRKLAGFGLEDGNRTGGCGERQ